MSEPSDWIDGIKARLDATPALAGITILIEDPENLDVQIGEALGKHGMLILIGQPRWRNLRDESQAAEFSLTSEIAVGEAPSIWRESELLIEPVSGVYAPTGHEDIGTVAYAGLVIGKQYRWAPGANEAAFESGATTLLAAGQFTADADNAQVTSIPGAGEAAFTGQLWTVPAVKPKCLAVAWAVTKRLHGSKIAGFRYISIHQGDPLPDTKRQLFQVLAATKEILGPNRDP